MIQLRFTLCIGSSICSLLRIYIRPLLLRMFLESRQPPMGKIIIWPRICLRNYMYLSRLNYLEFVLSFSMWFWDHWAFLVVQMVKNLPEIWETWVQSLGQEDLLEKGMAAHSSILAWRTPWTEKPCKLQSMGSQRVTWLSDEITALKLSDYRNGTIKWEK